MYLKRTLTGLITDKITKNWSGVSPYPDAGGPIAGSVARTRAVRMCPHIANISGTYPDFDLNIDVAPFRRLHVTDQRLTQAGAKRRGEGARPRRRRITIRVPVPFIKVEAEIDTGNAAKQEPRKFVSRRGILGKQIAMHGPWIYETVGHCDHPEIHPAEEIWWSR